MGLPHFPHIIVAIPLIVSAQHTTRASGPREGGQGSSQAAEKDGHRVPVAGNGEEAYELFRSHAADIKLIVTDGVMQRIDGTDKRVLRSRTLRWVELARLHLFRHHPTESLSQAESHRPSY